MRRTAIVAVSSVLLLVGCSQPSATNSDDFEGTEGAVAQTVADLADAGRNREATDICGGVVSEALRERMAAGDSTCNDEMQKAIEDADAFDITINDITVNGQRATAEVENSDGNRTVERTLELVREDGDWRVDSFG